MSPPEIQCSSSSRDRIEGNSTERESQRPTLYVFPKLAQPLAFFYLEDLEEIKFCVLCRQIGDAKKVFIWKGHEFEAKLEVEYCELG